MRSLRFVFWALVAVVLIVIGMANRGVVTLRLLPDGLTGLAGLSPGIDLPLFVVIFLGIALGLLIGFVWEWLREAQLRATARARHREVEALKSEVGRLKSQANVGKDEVLALLDNPR
jgi:lipopolysaccharide assembly protein A